MFKKFFLMSAIVMSFSSANAAPWVCGVLLGDHLAPNNGEIKDNVEDYANIDRVFVEPVNEQVDDFLLKARQTDNIKICLKGITGWDLQGIELTFLAYDAKLDQ